MTLVSAECVYICTSHATLFVTPKEEEEKKNNQRAFSTIWTIHFGCRTKRNSNSQWILSIHSIRFSLIFCMFKSTQIQILYTFRLAISRAIIWCLTLWRRTISLKLCRIERMLNLSIGLSNLHSFPWHLHVLPVSSKYPSYHKRYEIDFNGRIEEM